MPLDMDELVEQAFGFGFAMVSKGDPWPPTLIGLDAADEGRKLIVGCRPFDDGPMPESEQKHMRYTMMMLGARLWGATDLLFVADAHMKVMPKGDKLEDLQVMPRQDPTSLDALIVYEVRDGDVRSLHTYTYHLDDHGVIVKDERIDHSGDAGEGIVTDALVLTFKTPSHVLHGFTEMTGLSDPTDYLKMLAASGYLVVDTHDGTSMAYLGANQDDLATIKAMLDEAGWSEAE